MNYHTITTFLPQFKYIYTTGMYEVGKGSSKDRLIGKFYVGKFFPSSRLYMEDRLVGNFFPTALSNYT